MADAAFQWRYTVALVALGSGTTAAMGALWYRAHLSSSRMLVLEDPAVAELVARADAGVLGALVGLVLGIGALLAVCGLWLTQRVAGPATLLRRYCTELAAGAYPDVRPLRRRDELQACFVAFAAAVRALQARDREQHARLAAAATAAAAGLAAAAADPAAAPAHLAAAAAALARGRDALAVAARDPGAATLAPGLGPPTGAGERR